MDIQADYQNMYNEMKEATDTAVILKLEKAKLERDVEALVKDLA